MLESFTSFPQAKVSVVANKTESPLHLSLQAQVIGYLQRQLKRTCPQPDLKPVCAFSLRVV